MGRAKEEEEAKPFWITSRDQIEELKKIIQWENHSSRERTMEEKSLAQENERKKNRSWERRNSLDDYIRKTSIADYRK